MLTYAVPYTNPIQRQRDTSGETQWYEDACCEETLSFLSKKGSNCVVLLNNPCPCYLETLLDFKPWSVIAAWDRARAHALEAVARGERYFSVPLQRSVLTRSERDVLRLIALGLEAKGIARRLGNTPGTVNAHTRAIYSKLRAGYPDFALENHVHLTHFWRGHWHLLGVGYT